MKSLIILVAIISLVGCISKPPVTSQDFMVTCKSVCRAKVQHYQDDSIECMCRE